MTTDLYIGTLRRRPVAMVSQESQMQKKDEGPASESSHFEDRENPSQSFCISAVTDSCVVVQKGRKVPL